jgi:hypothetical protein
MSEIVIYQPWGGLGDNLAHTLIPELCKEKGYKCYLSSSNAYRNKQIYELVWGLNPYLEKETKDSKDLSWLDRCKFFENKGLSHVQVIQKAYGFTDSQIEYPKIYYTPKFLPEFKDKTFIDFNSISVPYNTNILQQCLKQLLIDKNLYEGLVTVRHSKIDNVNYNLPVKIESMDINDLFLYSDIIFSAKNIITLNSGITNLASTIKNQFNSDVQIYTFTYRKYMKEYGSNGYFYSNNNYIPVD